MNLVLLTETIVKMLVTDKEAVSVREYETTEENITKIEILVSKDDLGKVIGKEGRTIHSIRTIVQASSTINSGNRVLIDVDSY